MSVGYTNSCPIDSYERAELNWMKLEKGLLLFTYLYGSSKARLATDVCLWENEKKLLKKDLGSAEYSNIESVYSPKAAEANLSKEWAHASQYIRTQTDYDVYRLIRFVRNFGLFYFDPVIRHRSALFKDILLTMIHLVHHLSPKRPRSVEHIYLFLGKRTIQPWMSKKELLEQFIKPLDVPDVFFNRQVDFQTGWYTFRARRTKIDFNGLSSDFIQYFNRVFVRYYEGRLKSCRMKNPWV